MRRIVIFIIIFTLGCICTSALSPLMEKKHKEGITYFDKGEYKKALDCFKQILIKEPEATEIYNDLGLVYIKLGKSNEAIKQWLKALSLNPKFLVARYNLVRAYIDKKEYDEAILHLKTIIEQSPQEKKAYNTLGVIYWTKGQHDLAEINFKKAIKIEPDYKIALLNLARLYVEMATVQYQKLSNLDPKSKEIREEYRHILQVNQDASKLFLLGKLYQEEGALASAISEYRKAAQLDEKYGASSFINQALKMRESGYLEKAAENYEIALALGSAEKQIHYSLGEIYYLLKQYKKALAFLKRAVSLIPNFHYAHHYLGLTYYQLGQYDEAVLAFKKALALKDNYQTHYALGSTYEAMGKSTLARNEYKYAEKISPEAAKQIEMPPLFAEVQKFVKKWLEAWQNKDFETYPSYYSPQFCTNEINLEKWLKQKKFLFSTRDDIKINISHLKITQQGEITIVCFHQQYQDNKLQDKGEKCLYLEDKKGWHILKEEWHPIH